MISKNLFDLFDLGIRISATRYDLDVEEALEDEPQKQELWGSDEKTDVFNDKNFIEWEE